MKYFVLLVIISFYCVCISDPVVADAKGKAKEKHEKYCKKCDAKKCVDYEASEFYCCRPIDDKCCAENLHEKLNCTGDVYIFGPDNCNCQRYYQCFSSKLNHFWCPVGGAWTNDSSTPACLVYYDPVTLCGDRPFKPKMTFAKFIKVTLTIRDSTVNPPVVNVSFSGIVLQQPLYDIMLGFAATRNDFTFVTSFQAVFWRSLTCINSQCAVWNPDKTYWKSNYNGNSLPVGISSFVPEDNHSILFDFVTFKVHPYG